MKSRLELLPVMFAVASLLGIGLAKVAMAAHGLYAVLSMHLQTEFTSTIIIRSLDLALGLCLVVTGVAFTLRHEWARRFAARFMPFVAVYEVVQSFALWTGPTIELIWQGLLVACILAIGCLASGTTSRQYTQDHGAPVLG